MQRSTRARRRCLAAALVTISALAAGTLASAAQAADLIVLGPDSATLAGTAHFDHVYIGDGATLRLAGDTAIVANDVYVAGGAALRTCFVQGVSDTGCTAGRSLLIQSTGQINVGSGIALTAGTGTPRPGGNLVLIGASIAVTGGIDTSGTAGGLSGSVVVSSPGAVAISAPYYQASVNAPGAPVSIHGASVGLTGDLNTGGSDATISSAGAVDVGASTGPLTIRGTVNASGRDGTTGYANDVSLHGTDVRVGRVDASAGTGSPAAPGGAGSVGIGGTSSVSVSDFIDVRGASGAAGYDASGAGNVLVTSSGPILAGAVYASGSDANNAAPSNPGSISISGSAVAVGQLFVNGANRSVGIGLGSPGGIVSVNAAGALTVDEVEAFGGNSIGGLPGGHGGQIALTGDGIFSSELRTTPGSSGGSADGGSGGSVTVNGRSAVTILGGVYTGGGNASGGVATNGGWGGNVILHATAGPLALSSPVRTSGGNGANAPAGQKAGAGGRGGALDLVGTPIDPIAGINTEGGDGGFSNDNDHRGAGGAGGAVHAWSETDIFSTLRAISTAGGGGAPPGVDGPQLQDSGPTGLTVDANGVLSFTSQSPSAQGYRVFRTLGDQTTAILTTVATRVALPAIASCTPVSYQVQAFSGIAGWASPATPAFPWIKQPSATQRCTDAPTLSHAKTVLVKKKKLTRAKGAFSFVATANGLGSVTATATIKGVKAPLAVTTVALAKAGTFLVTLKLDQKVKLKYVQPKKKKGKKKRPPAVARVSVKLVASAPAGTATTSITVPVEVRT